MEIVAGIVAVFVYLYFTGDRELDVKELRKQKAQLELTIVSLNDELDESTEIIDRQTVFVKDSTALIEKLTNEIDRLRGAK